MTQTWMPLVAPQNNTQKYKILFLILSCIVIFTYFIYFRIDFNVYSPETYVAHTDFYYILQWTTGKVSPFYHMGTGSSKFVILDCPYQNCHVTDNRTFLRHIKDFDAIVFNGNDVIRMNESHLPQERSRTQKFVFGGTESAPNRMACKPVLDNFFNWTWTYRLDSDVRWSYILIYDLEGNDVGPKPKMEWPEEMKPIKDDETIAILDGKSKAAAWFVTHCKTMGGREGFVKKVKPELTKLNLTLDVYGKCGELECPRNKADECYDMVKKDYYFYFSFENSFATDYVTEKLLTALNNYAIPVVYGGADYSRPKIYHAELHPDQCTHYAGCVPSLNRNGYPLNQGPLGAIVKPSYWFLPPGSYLNARELGPEQLAQTMKEIMDNRTRYHDFFRWRNHFIYKQGENNREICNLCAALNDRNKVNNIDIHDHFRQWWNEGYNKRCKS